MELTWLCGDKEVEVKIPDRNVMQVITPKNIPPIKDVKGAFRHALENPTESKKISELVKPNYKVTLITNSPGHSPGGYDRWLDLVIDELHKGGVKDDNINFIIGRGVHREAPRKVLEEMLGNVTEQYEVTNNQRDDKFVFKGITPTYATPVWVNERADADLTIGLGAFSFNNCAGYGGGVKTLCPGACSYDTICTNHRLGVSPLSKPGNPENPMRWDMEEMADMANFKFIINTAVNNKEELLHIGAGDPVKVHREGVKKTWEFNHFDLPEQADILIGNSNATWPGLGSFVIMSHLAVRKGGTIILTQKVEWPEHPAIHRAPCQWWEECDDSFRKIRPDTNAVLLDIHQNRLPAWVGATVGFGCAKVMAEKEIILVNAHLKEEHVKGSGWKYSNSLDEALRQAFDKHGRDAKVVIVPNPGRFAHLSSKK